jgi:large subunit ribosomal protein L23
MVSIIRNSAGILDIIQYPCMSSKAKYLNEKRSQIVVFVEIDATKIEIKKAVEAIFGMKVEKVNTVVLKGKNKKSARRFAYTEKKRKKAVVVFKDKELAKKMSHEDQDSLLVNSPLDKE